MTVPLCETFQDRVGQYGKQLQKVISHHTGLLSYYASYCPEVEHYTNT